ncbi:MAG: serine/threonine-protein kinase [Kofleriaceae bacterium]
MCLDDETVLGMVEGRLAPPVLAAVDDHLDGCDTCRDVLAQLARVRSPSQVLERGAALGRYVIGELLGSGAMGRVYSAWEPELDRRVAIKVLREDAPGGRERLVREAQAMAKLDHPNIVGVHEVGSSADVVFVAMDLVEGETLRSWAEQPRAWRDVTRVVIDIARGLAAVHAAGVIHRDVKPDNIIVGSDGRARLGDFGLARAGASAPTAHPDPDATLALGTPATAIAGTPAYMAPEVLRGGSATPASDQFGLGVTAYEILAGRRPFAGTSWAELSHLIERGVVAPLRDVPGWFDAAIRRCLAADPARRHASLEALAALVGDRAQRRRPMWIAGAAAAAIVASGATWMVVSSRVEPTAGASCAVGATEIAQIWNAGTRTGFDVPTLAALDGWTTQWARERDATCALPLEPAKLAARQRCLDHQRGELAALLAATGDRSKMIDALATLAPADCRTALPGTADALPADLARAAAAREVGRGLPAIRAAIALGHAPPTAAASAALVERATASGHAPTLAEALLAHAETLRATSQLPAAAVAARDAAAAAERGHDDETAARAWLARITIAGDRRDLADFDDLAAIALAAIDRAGAPPRLVAQLLRGRALVAYNRGQLGEARTLLDDARRRFAEISGERSLDVATIESALGSTARAAGALDDAERHHRAALAIDRALRGDKHPDIARDLHNLAGVLRLRGDLDGAEPMYRDALAIEIATRGERSVEAGITHNSLGLVRMARGDWTGARTELEQASTLLAAAGHGDRVFAEHNLGIVAAGLGDHVAALAHYDAAAAIYAVTIGNDASGPIRLHLDRARSLLARGELVAARDEARRAAGDARAAGFEWIAADADAVLAGKRIAFAGQRAPIDTVVEPAPRTDRPKQPAKPAAPVQPVRDIGTYGSSQGF